LIQFLSNDGETVVNPQLVEQAHRLPCFGLESGPDHQTARRSCTPKRRIGSCVNLDRWPIDL